MAIAAQKYEAPFPLSESGEKYKIWARIQVPWKKRETLEARRGTYTFAETLEFGLRLILDIHPPTSFPSIELLPLQSFESYRNQK